MSPAVRLVFGDHCNVLRRRFRDDDDYDIDFYTVDPIPTEVNDPQSSSLSPREQYEVRYNFVSDVIAFPSPFSNGIIISL